MAGTFSKSARPKRPGAYFNFIARNPEPILVNTQGVVVVPFTHSWGPAEEVTELNSWGDFLAIFGHGAANPDTYSPGYQAVFDAFRGEGLPGFGGAGRVLAYRMTGAAAAEASRTLQNTTPAAALPLEAVYPGTYGNEISLTVAANGADPTNDNDLIVLVQGVEVERFTHAKTDIDDLAAQIDGTGAYDGKGSDWIRTSGAVTSGTALALVTDQALTGGNDGSTLLAQDWTDLRTAIEPHRFSVLAAQDLTDQTIIDSLFAWAVGTDAAPGLNRKGKRFLTIVGGGTGATAETMDAAITRSGTVNDPDFVNVGGGLYTDDKFGDLHPARLVARVAGIVAQRGERLPITFARLAGLKIKTGVTEADILRAIENGVVTIARDSFEAAPTRLELGVTAFTDENDDARPVSIYSNIKFVRTMHALEMELTEFAEARVIGRMPVNAGTRDYLRGQMEARMQDRENREVILPGWTVQISQDPPPSDLDSFVSLDYQLEFGRDLQQIFNTVTVG